MIPDLSVTTGSLEQAYRTRDPVLAGHQQAEAVEADAEGITVLCSADPKGEGRHTWLIQLADDGSVRWERHYAPELGAGQAMAVLPGGGFVIAGAARRGVMEYQAHLLRLDARGGVIAAGAFGARGANGFATVAALKDGSTLAGGTADWKGWLACVDGALRARWERALDDVDDVRGLAPLADGGFALAGALEKSTTALGRTCLAAFGGDGRLRWQKRLPPAGRGEPAALCALPDGSLAALGHGTASDRDAAQMWVARIRAAGEVAWERRLGPAGEERRGRVIVALAGEDVAVAGEGLRDGRRGLRLARLTADGTVVWERAYGGKGHDTARGLARTADGGLALVGSTTERGPGKTNVWILRLDDGGRLLWDRVFGSAG